MSLAPTPTPVVRARDGSCYLAAFDKVMAPIVAGWGRDAQELFWLAPRTPFPLTAAKVVGWACPGGCPLLLQRDGRVEPLGYLELNPMPGEPAHFWLGHCVIDPDHRSIGLGRLMIGLALRLGFRQWQAERISLVVFPENTGAIRCYQGAGFLHSGDQIKYFHTTHRQHRMLQMTIERERFDSLTTGSKRSW